MREGLSTYCPHLPAIRTYYFYCVSMIVHALHSSFCTKSLDNSATVSVGYDYSILSPITALTSEVMQQIQNLGYWDSQDFVLQTQEGDVAIPASDFKDTMWRPLWLIPYTDSPSISNDPVITGFDGRR